MANTTGKKFGGRNKGTPNRQTSEIKTLIQQVVECNIAMLQRDFDSLEAKDRLAFFEKVLRFVIPAQASNEININALTESELNTLCDSLLNKLNSDETTD
jgi:hypothetical protein